MMTAMRILAAALFIAGAGALSPQPAIANDLDLMQDHRIAAALHALKDGKYRTAVHGYRRAVRFEQDPDRRAELQTNLCAALRLGDQPVQAKEACDAAVRHMPSLWQAHINLALIAEETGDPDAARRHLAEARKHHREARPLAATPQTLADAANRLTRSLAQNR